jgi:hypothetical protein
MSLSDPSRWWIGIEYWWPRLSLSSTRQPVIGTKYDPWSTPRERKGGVDVSLLRYVSRRKEMTKSSLIMVAIVYTCTKCLKDMSSFSKGEVNETTSRTYSMSTSNTFSMLFTIKCLWYGMSYQLANDDIHCILWPQYGLFWATANFVRVSTALFTNDPTIHAARFGVIFGQG